MSRRDVTSSYRNTSTWNFRSTDRKVNFVFSYRIHRASASTVEIILNNGSELIGSRSFRYIDDNNTDAVSKCVRVTESLCTVDEKCTAVHRTRIECFSATDHRVTRRSMIPFFPPISLCPGNI